MMQNGQLQSKKGHSELVVWLIAKKKKDFRIR
jgi:hypothetical protein